MMFNKAAALLRVAMTPEDIFGDKDQIAGKYRELAKATHPDSNKGSNLANEIFQLLQAWHAKAMAKVAARTYGDRRAHVRTSITHRTARYTIMSRVASGDLAEVYGGVGPGKHAVLIKVGRMPVNNDLLANEAKTLRYMCVDAPVKDLAVMQHIPKFVDAFQLADGKLRKQVNVIEWVKGGYTLEDVMRVYPDGIDPRDMAWMFNRVLGGLLAAHQAQRIHGAVVPSHVLIFPETHNGMLIDWSYSVEPNHALRAIAPRWRAFYPPEVLIKNPATTGTDIYMAAKCALALLGKMPAAAPRAIVGFMRACTLGPAHRPRDVYELFVEFQDILKALYGKPAFRKFTMLEKKGGG